MDKKFEELEWKGRISNASIRTADQMDRVCYDLKFLRKKDGNKPVYYMHRQLECENNIRYDITIIPPLMMGEEYVKTFGHYHPPANKNGSYTELYEVLDGSAIYLLQKLTNGKVSDVIVIEAKKGDVVPIPPDYGHVTINPGTGVLKMANLVSNDFNSEYIEYERLRGGAYYFLEGRRWIRNPNYENLPEIRFLAPSKKFQSGIINMLKDPKKLEFLQKPEKFNEICD